MCVNALVIWLGCFDRLADTEWTMAILLLKLCSPAHSRSHHHFLFPSIVLQCPRSRFAKAPMGNCLIETLCAYFSRTNEEWRSAGARQLPSGRRVSLIPSNKRLSSKALSKQVSSVTPFMAASDSPTRGDAAKPGRPKFDPQFSTVAERATYDPSKSVVAYIFGFFLRVKLEYDLCCWMQVLLSKAWLELRCCGTRRLWPPVGIGFAYHFGTSANLSLPFQAKWIRCLNMPGMTEYKVFPPSCDYRHGFECCTPSSFPFFR